MDACSCPLCTSRECSQYALCARYSHISYRLENNFALLVQCQDRFLGMVSLAFCLVCSWFLKSDAKVSKMLATNAHKATPNQLVSLTSDYASLAWLLSPFLSLTQLQQNRFRILLVLALGIFLVPNISKCCAIFAMDFDLVLVDLGTQL